MNKTGQKGNKFIFSSTDYKSFNGKMRNIQTHLDSLGGDYQKDMDHVFEFSDGFIINIQFDGDGKRYVGNFENANDYSKSMEMKNYRDFYNEVERYGKFKFIGYADGHLPTLFN